MAKEKTVNYTDDMVATIVEMYEQGGNAAIPAIAEKVARGERSVRAKLASLGVYVKDVASVKATVDKGPTKKEMLAKLRGLVEFDVGDNFNALSKAGVQKLIDHFSAQASEAETEVETD